MKIAAHDPCGARTSRPTGARRDADPSLIALAVSRLTDPCSVTLADTARSVEPGARLLDGSSLVQAVRPFFEVVMIGKVIRVSLPIFGFIYIVLSLPENFNGGFVVFICAALAAYVANREAGL